MTRTVSVVMPVKNEDRRIAKALAAVRAQTLKPLEVIVVDGHSTDRTVEIAKTFGSRVFFEDFHTRAGACDVGLRAAEGELVAFTDADCVPDPQWLESLEKNLGSGLAGVGGRILNEGDTFWQRSIDAALDTVMGSANSVQGRDFREKRFVSSISGCNSMYRRGDLVAAGGFKTRLVTSEDTELNRRMMAFGKLLYVPSALVVHRHQRGLRNFAHRMFQYGYGRGQTLLVGPPLLMPMAALAFVVLGYLRPTYALIALAAYLLLLLGSSIASAAKHKQARFAASVAVVYLVEHVFYAVGFWIGIFRARLPRRRKAPSAGGESA